MFLAPLMFQAGAADMPQQPSILVQFLPFIAILAVFYFLLIRPQQKRQKEHRAMLDALKKGDTIVTSGGIIGKVAKVSDDEITVDTGEGVKLRVVRTMVVDVRGKGEPVPANDTKAG